MTWAKIDDQFYTHPKVGALDLDMMPAAVGLYALALSWCADQLTDGRIPRSQAARLLGTTAAYALADELVRVGLWETTADGYVFHDYLTYNPTRDKVLAERAAARERMQELRRSSGEVRANNGRSSTTGSVTPVPVSRIPDPNTQTQTPEETGGVRARAETVVALYHELCPELPHVSELTEPRKRRSLALLKRCGDDGTRNFFARVAKSDLLMGLKPGRDWRADFDWLLKPEHVLKIFEGSYDNRGKSGVSANVASALALVQKYEEEARHE